jgi:D-glycero-D-manno-heptose 1,7-bisphosphate phosphatase
MKRPAIFFDRDNTLIVSDGYLGDPDKVILMEGAADAVVRAREMGFATVVVSNQSGVARGMFSENDVILVNRRMDEMLLAANPAAVIDRHEFCPFHPEAPLEQYRKETHLRKPGPGMILEAAEKLALDLSRSWLIGDAPRDIEAGQAAGCRTILLHLPDLPASPAASEKLSTPPDCIVANLKEAMDFIEKSLQAADEPPAPALPASSSTNAPAPLLAPAVAEPVVKLERLENLAEQILTELRQRNQHADYADFSISKLMAGIVQVIAVALMFLAYLAYTRTGDKGWDNFYSLMAYALFFQMFTISLLIMGRQK